MRNIWTDVKHPPCPVCGRDVPKRQNDKPNTWIRRKTCSKECLGGYYSITSSKEYEHPPCTSCGREVARREGEPKNNWRQRSCCSKDCARSRCIDGAIKSNETKRIEHAGKNTSRVAKFEALFVGKPFAAYDADPGDGGRPPVSRPETFIPTRGLSASEDALGVGVIKFREL
jgi:hypothetical protein